MKMPNSLLWTSLGVAALGMAGCDLFIGGRAREDRVLVQEQPVYQAQPAYVEQQPQYVVVQQAPPPLIVERRPPAPSAAHIWIDGSWNWDNQRYVWSAGRYALPPEPDAIWIAPRYEVVGGARHYTPGQWSKPKNNPAPGRGRGRGN